MTQEFIPYSKQIPLTASVDVLVAGAGIAGCIAALTAARNGADVMLVDRFGSLGGNMGPGMFSGGVLHLSLHFPETMPGGLQGIPGEFLNRCGAFTDGQLGHHYHKESEVVSYVWLKLMEENNVRLMLNTTAGDPIMEGNRVTGMFLENRLGTQAVKAKVVIDATGDADVAFRTGAPTHPCSGYYHPGMYFSIGDVDEVAYRAFVDRAGKPDPKNLRWANDLHKSMGIEMGFFENLSAMLPAMKTAYMHREYKFVQKIGDLASIGVDHGFFFRRSHPGLVGAQVGLWPLKKHGVTDVLNELEIAARKYIFETAQFLRHHIPGFEHSYLHATSPYFHSRGGRSAICRYRLTKADVAAGRNFNDTVFRTWASEAKTSECTANGFDFPYRQLLPKGIDGLLMAGRSAIIQPPTNRTRFKVMLMGQAAGLAAALAARDSVGPDHVDINELQQILVTKYKVPMRAGWK